MKSILSVAELRELIQQNDVLLIDARSGLQARADYLKQHLSGSVYVDLETELSDKKPDSKEGGRHPLPTISRFCELLSQIGLTPDSKIVVYDDKCGANAAARFWWMVRAVGHQSVAVLDGGLQAAVQAGLPVESGLVTRTQSSFRYPTQSWLWPVSTLKEVEVASQTASRTIVDVREGYRYRGESEPIDLVAGHIPGAINIPYLENLTDQGLFLDAVSLGDRYRAIGKAQASGSTIVHCGSGVSACHTILAMEYAGLPVPSLFVGSWSEWSRNPLPIAVANDS